MRMFLVCCSVLTFHVIVLMFHILVTFRSNGSGIFRDEEALLCLCHGLVTGEEALVCLCHGLKYCMLVSSRVFCMLV